MSDVNLAFAFTAGIVATINPCGFAMLPAYISYFLGIEATSSPSLASSITRALVTGSVVSAGFLFVFGIAGLLVSLGFTAIRGIVPWIAIGVGVTLIILGCLVSSGRRIDIALPKFSGGTDGKNLRSLRFPVRLHSIYFLCLRHVSDFVSPNNQFGSRSFCLS